MKELLYKIVSSPSLHAKWLNTLSYLENCGARKIAACEHPTLVKEEMLKHAAEEFRHAHHLKRQIVKVSSPLDTYSDILGGMAARHYITALNVKISRENKNAAYFLVTYAIELRALELYTAYGAVLKECQSKVTVRSILLEEMHHLEEMRQEVDQLPSGLIEKALAIEEELYKKWWCVLTNKVNSAN